MHSWATVLTAIKNYRSVMCHLAKFNYNNVDRKQVSKLKSAQLMRLDEPTIRAIDGINELLKSIRNYYAVKDASKKVK